MKATMKTAGWIVSLAVVCGLGESALATTGAGSSCPATTTPRVLIAGDSWAQYMWDDGSYGDLFDKFGHADKSAISRSLGSNPGPGHTGPEYAVSGSEAREWADTANYPWIANMAADLAANPTVDTVVLSIGGNDILAGRSGGGWYKDMDVDVSGSEETLFQTIEADTAAIAAGALAAAPGAQILVSSYEYPNFNVDALWCWIYACPKRDDLSRDPVGDLVTDQELNAMMASVEQRRIAWTNADPSRRFDNSLGLMHHVYGDGVSGPGVLPKPGLVAPEYLPFPAGNPVEPTLRENFRAPGGVPADPIHLDFEGYRYKIAHQLEGSLFGKFRGEPTQTFFSRGSGEDGWTDRVSTGVEAVRVGDTGADPYFGIVSFDTAAIPDGSTVTAASLYLLRQTGVGDNPFSSGVLGTARLDVKTGAFGAPGIEVADADAAADAVDAGCFIGSVEGEFWALRVDLSSEGLAAVNDRGLTQLRLSFPGIDSGEDRVSFHTGDAALLAPEERLRWQIRSIERAAPDGSVDTVQEILGALVHQGVGEITGTLAPFLDVTFLPPDPDIFADGFESGDLSAWSRASP